MNIALVKPSLDELRQLIGSPVNQGKEKSSFSLYPGGFSLGSVIEVVGPGKTELIAQFFAEHLDFKIAWIEDVITVNPYALFQRGLDLKNILFVETKRELLWCLTQALQSGCFQAVVTGNAKFKEKDLRRYQLLAEKGHAHFFMLSEQFHQSWVPHLQLEVFDKKITTYKKRGYG